LKRTRKEARTTQKIIEVVGPPGSGKTTLLEILGAQEPKWIIKTFPYFRRTQNLEFFIIQVVTLLPLLFDIYRTLKCQQRKRDFIEDCITFPFTYLPKPSNRNSEYLTHRDIAIMAILHGWHQILIHDKEVNNSSLLLDEGPICLMAKLYGFRFPIFEKSRRARQWWDSISDRWAKTLNIIVKLDAPSVYLLERIRARKESFEFVELSDEDAVQYLNRINSAQEGIISWLKSKRNGLVILRFNTIQESPDQIAKEIIASFPQLM
jgi:hypothetical protein